MACFENVNAGGCFRSNNVVSEYLRKFWAFCAFF